MDVLLIAGFSAGLFVMLEWRLRNRPEPQEVGGGIEEWGLFSAAFIRRRLAALADELDRLDHDPLVFAKAHHTMAARSAYDALMADASRLTELPRAQAGAILDAEPVVGARDVREVLEL